jgi:poly-beta-1,6-N-acetyl-D-glucosamine synthase
VMKAVFWLSAAGIAYVYVGYPVLLGVWAWLVRSRQRVNQTRATRRDDAALPGVTIVIAARDEACRLPARIDNLLAADYPHDRMQIIVASDGSSDDTAAALAPYSGCVELLNLPASGKAAALNAAVARARYPILVFADARQRFASDAIRRLAPRFEDPEVGAVSGELLIDGSASTIGDGIGAYWRYEKWLRRQEAIVGSTLGVTGAIYAMRRELWRPLPPDTILDDVLTPMRVILGGHRVVFEARARAFDEAPSDATAELRRKVRTLTGNFQLVAREPRLLVPGVNPVWLQFMSHKIGRLLVPYALITLYGSSAVLSVSSRFFAVACLAQLGFYGLAAYGARVESRRLTAPVERPEEETRRAAA